VTVAIMLVVVFANRLFPGAGGWLGAAGRLAWPWYVPVGTVLTILVGAGLSFFRPLPKEAV
jgi:hypothetical protein